MLYICIISNKFDLKRTIRVCHITNKLAKSSFANSNLRSFLIIVGLAGQTNCLSINSKTPSIIKQNETKSVLIFVEKFQFKKLVLPSGSGWRWVSPSFFRHLSFLPPSHRNPLRWGEPPFPWMEEDKIKKIIVSSKSSL